MIHVDTHVAVWTHLGQTRRLTQAARKALGTEPMRFSPMLRLELQLLHETGRLPASSPVAVIHDLVKDFGATESQANWSDVVDLAHSLSWTRDPFDRLIVANAAIDGARLITADNEIVDHFDGAVW